MIKSKKLIVKKECLIWFHYPLQSPSNFRRHLQICNRGLYNILNDTIILIFQVFLEEVMALYCSGYLGYKNIDFT